MQKFSFPLERVLAWRRVQRDREVAKVEQLVASRHALDAREQSIRDERNQFERELAQSLSFDASAVATLPQWQARARQTLTAIGSERRQLEDRLRLQRDHVREKERDVKLLERLREQRFSRWSAEVDREQETFAAEAYLARCIRLKKQTDTTGA